MSPETTSLNKGPVEVRVILPPRAKPGMGLDLVELTEEIWKRDHADESYGYGLGGEYGYGVEFENAVFRMWPFYWGDCTCGWETISEDIGAEPHDADCYQTDLDARFEASGLGYDPETWRPRNPDLSYEVARAKEEVIYRAMTSEYGLSMLGRAAHCTCTRPTRFQRRFDAVKLGPEGHADPCPTIRPNFLHKPSGLEVDWYKWIGRDMTTSRPVNRKEWRAIFQECLASLR